MLGEKFSEAMRVARAKKNISQKEAAHLAGIAQNNWCQIETGKTEPTIGTMEKIANSLGLEIEIRTKELITL